MIRYNDFTERFFDADGNIVHPREVIERLETLRQERDALKKRVEELEEANSLLATALSDIIKAVKEASK